MIQRDYPNVKFHRIGKPVLTYEKLYTIAYDNKEI
jgi:hypothetical protein